MPAYRLSPRARKSLEQISAYTGDNHGQQQRRRYLRLLRDRMREVARNPDLGRRRDDIKAGYFSVVAGKHTIYYRIQGRSWRSSTFCINRWNRNTVCASATVTGFGLIAVAVQRT